MTNTDISTEARTAVEQATENASASTGLRVVDGVALPAAGTYVLDPTHTRIGFVARHLMVTKVRGRFAGVTGSIVVGDDPAASSTEVTIEAASIDTRSPDRDAHLRGPDFLDVEQFPTLEFRSSRVYRAKGDWKLDGQLTIKGVTRPVTLDVDYDGEATDPWGNTKVGFTARADIDREDWGLTWNVALETGGVLVSRKIQLELDVQAVKQPA
jgi:polyisoprenoid-binding protein YceI